MPQMQWVMIGAAAIMAVATAVPTTAAQVPDMPPWAVPTDNPVEQRSIVIENRGAKLAGTLYVPRGTQPRAAVIALHGAQAPLRSTPLYRHLTEIMPRLGIAVFLPFQREDCTIKPWDQTVRPTSGPRFLRVADRGDRPTETGHLGGH